MKHETNVGTTCCRRNFQLVFSKTVLPDPHYLNCNTQSTHYGNMKLLFVSFAIKFSKPEDVCII